MSKYYGDIAENATIEIPFNTFNSDGASVTFTGTTVKVYKDSATGTEVTTGVTLSKDHDGITGAHLITIVATDAFYATGSDYLVELQAATIDSQTVNAILGTFSIQNRFMRGTDSGATEAKQDAGDSVTTRIAAIQEGDEVFDFANGTVEIFPKGTTSGGLLKKNLYDKNDDIVDDTEAIISRTEDVTP